MHTMRCEKSNPSLDKQRLIFPNACRAALRNFETYGQAAAAEIQDTQQLLAEIEQAMSS